MDMDFKSNNHNLNEALKKINCNNKTEMLNACDSFKDCMPNEPPPNYIPFMAKDQCTEITETGIEAEAIKKCVNNYVYLMLNNGTSFWAYLIFVGEKSTSGYRWTDSKWIYFGVSFQLINYFECN